MNSPAGSTLRILGLVLTVVTTVMGAFVLTLQDVPQARSDLSGGLAVTRRPSPSLPGLTVPLASATPAPTQAVPSAIPALNCTPPASWQPVEIRQDETLLNLSLHYDVPVQDIQQANCLENLLVTSGQVLYLPESATPSPSPFASPSPSASPSPIPPTATATQGCRLASSWVPYQVQPGDTMYSLALRSGTTLRAVEDGNCLDNSAVYPGLVILLPRIPVNRPTATPAQRNTLPPTATPAQTNTPQPPASPSPQPQPGGGGGGGGHGGGGGSSPTNTPVPVPTNTPVPLPTNTPKPIQITPTKPPK